MKWRCVASAALTLWLLPGSTLPHAGEDHSGESLAATASASPSDAPLQVAVETQILAQIRTAPVVMSSLPQTLRVLGRTRVKPDREAVLTSVAEGRLVAAESAPPTLGDRVRKGQVLALVEEVIPAADLIPIISERARVAGEVDEAAAEVVRAQRDYERLTSVRGAVTEREIDSARAALDVATARLEGVRGQLAQLEQATADAAQGVRKRPVVAPIDGMIAESHATLGENVTPDKALYRIVDLSEVLVEADVFENDVAAVLEAEEARLQVEAFGGEAFPARLVSRGTTVDPETRALHVLFAVDNGDERLFAGMFGQVFIDKGEAVSGLAVPRGAVVDAEGRSLVYVKVSGEVFMPVAVRILVRAGDVLLVEPLTPGALKEGQRVVVQGTYQVRMSKPIQ